MNKIIIICLVLLLHISCKTTLNNNINSLESDDRSIFLLSIGNNDNFENTSPEADSKLIEMMTSNDGYFNFILQGSTRESDSSSILDNLKTALKNTSTSSTLFWFHEGHGNTSINTALISTVDKKSIFVKDVIDVFKEVLGDPQDQNRRKIKRFILVINACTSGNFINDIAEQISNYADEYLLVAGSTGFDLAYGEDMEEVLMSRIVLLKIMQTELESVRSQLKDKATNKNIIKNIIELTKENKYIKYMVNKQSINSVLNTADLMYRADDEKSYIENMIDDGSYKSPTFKHLVDLISNFKISDPSSIQMFSVKYSEQLKDIPLFDH